MLEQIILKPLTKEELEKDLKKQRKIYKLEDDLVDAGVVDRDHLERLWQHCHEHAWDPIHDYNSMIISKHRIWKEGK